VEDDRPYLINHKTQNRTGTTKNGVWTPTKLKASYTVRMEMWAVGTYQLDEDGAPIIENGRVKPFMNANGKKATTKATVVKQKVFIR
ncbi:MAG: hypothetical protein FWH32_08720, partial [Clostridiales bacterium]|nr:hypothetical protein [Clostridiales bacterium]MCL2112301.1 hypothetical protein [Clostridiales bacterium]